MSRPAGNAILRKLTQPLYDTVILENAGAAPNLYQYFIIPIGGNLAVANVPKTLADTNLDQASQLGVPSMYDLMGFNFELFVADPTDLNDNVEDIFQLYEQSVFTFFFGTNRPWLSLPLSQIPTGTALTGSADTSVGVEEALFVHQGLARQDEVYDFTVRKRAIRIHSAENFHVEIDWPNGGTAAWQMADTRTRVFMVGNLYSAL
jgi:hypothetical protein